MMLLIIWLLVNPAIARDNGQYSQSDPEIKNWIEGLKDKNNKSCCNTADGYDVQWDTQNGKYRVYINDEWWVVPDEALLDKEPNKLGVARVWYIKVWDTNQKMVPTIRCFIPGAQG